MALFDAPLHKPGNRRCPNCGNPVWWASMSWWWNGSSTYLCSRCGADLRVAIGRSVLGWALCVGYYALFLWLVDSGPGWAGLPFMYGGIPFLAFTLWWFTSARLSEKSPSDQRISADPPLYRPGNKKCPNCGSPVRRESMGYLWSTRYCTQCGAALRHDVSRFFVGLVLTAPLLAAWVWSIFDETLLPRWVRLLFPFGFILFLLFEQWWSFSVRLREKAALKPLGP